MERATGSIGGRVPSRGFRPDRARRRELAPALFTGWPDAPLWINAVELDTGRRVTFGRDIAHAPDVADAVAASCAIPAFFAPVVIDGVRYVDGGVHSPTNADLVAGLGLDLVIVSSPMSVAAAGFRMAPDQPARRLARYALGREVARVRRSGTPVLTFQPTDTDLAVMGLNAMEESRRAGHPRRVRIGEPASRFDRRARPSGGPQALGDVSASLSSSVIPASIPAPRTAMSGAVSRSPVMP